MPSKLPRYGLIRAVVAAAAGAVVACGPSVQVLHENTVRFEHCYRLDLDPTIAPSHRRACWQAWVDRYSYGQPRDRFEYAQRRIAAIDRNEPPPGLDLEDVPRRALSMEPDGPIDVHAPPPRMSRPTDGLRSNDEEKPSSLEAPGDACSRMCRQQRSACLETCAPGEVCACEDDYRVCMVGCFE